jgi:hypothetical protein
MFDARGSSPVGSGSRDSVMIARETGRDDEARVAATLRNANSFEDGLAVPSADGIVGRGRHGDRPDAKIRRVAADILKSVQTRLPGRVRDLKVRFEHEQFVLSGVSSSYYVKQVAQHVAMNALEATMLGRLVNEIEVRSVR